MKLMQLTKMTWKTLMTGVTVKSLSILLGAVLACTAPFIHMGFPKKSTEIVLLEKKFQDKEVTGEEYERALIPLKEAQKTLGFSSPRRFWYAIGLPITLFFFSTLFLFIVNFVNDTSIRFAIRFSGFILFFISVYNLVWVMWPGQDLPKNVYHLSIALMSITSAALAFSLIQYGRRLRHKVQKLIRFISIDVYNKYVKPEDKRDFVNDSYKVYDDITK